MRLLTSDPVTRTQTFFHYDEATDDITLHEQQDVTAVVELTQAEFNALDERSPWKKDICHVARVPLNLVADLQRRGIWQDDKALNKWLDDRNNRKVRTRPGRLSK